MPLLGFGVFQNYDAKASVIEAFKAGYRCVFSSRASAKRSILSLLNSRHIDSAQVYRNEADVGEGVRASGLNRRDVFISV